ncbi:conserved Plasmodium protein, unknown function [Plasmodium ovale wallikeri]|uniref:Uncharacterized protein n=1 Tax=Plasmodium ovale wallikeri TaxID=864142 RepID=A0A1A8ZQ00_PLAOA|nr:conserved Plasmodium protein, unknown function [Plasmodium ovale wallikeri]
MMDKEQNENMSEKEIQNFFSEIEHLVNEDNADTKEEEQLKRTCTELIGQKKNSSHLPIHSKIDLFLEEVNFINHTFDVYERKRELEREQVQRKNEGDDDLRKEETKESDDILNDVIYWELGLTESEQANDTKKLLIKISEHLGKIRNKEFVLTTKKALDIRIEDFRKSEITEAYFAKNIRELYEDAVSQLDAEQNEDEQKLKENDAGYVQNGFVNDLERNKLDEEFPGKETMHEAQRGGISTPSATDGMEEAKLTDKNLGGKIVSRKANSQKSKKGLKIESSNFFHKKKMKLMARWHKVAEQTKLMNDPDYSS